MRKFIGLLGSIGIGLVLTAAGLIYDARILLDVGIALFGLVAVLWLWSWAHPVPASARPNPIALHLPQSEPLPTDPKGKALHTLWRARESAAIARTRRDDQVAGRAYHELEAAMLSIKKQFGIGPLKLSSKTHNTVPFKVVLEAYIAFVDRIYPLLREGHVEEAIAKANSFKWSWGSE